MAGLLGISAYYHDSAAALVVDGRVLAAAQEERFSRLKERFEDLSGVPVLLNTSLNGADEPIVNSPVEAFHCFMQLELDCLVMGNCLLVRKAQPGLPAAGASATATATATAPRGRLLAALARAQTNLILGSVYALVIIPTGWISRALGRNPLALGFEAERSSYRVASAAPNSMRQPF